MLLSQKINFVKDFCLMSFEVRLKDSRHFQVARRETKVLKSYKPKTGSQNNFEVRNICNQVQKIQA